MTPLNLSAPIELVAASGKSPAKFRIVAYTGGVMSPPGWPAVAVDLAASTIPATLAVLAEHKNELDAVIGNGSPSIVGGALIVTGEFADTESANTTRSLIASGVPLQASIGLEPLTKQYIKPAAVTRVNGQTLTAGPNGLTIVTGKLREVSILPNGADSDTSVSLAAKARQKATTMETTTTVPPTETTTQTIDAAAHNAELARIAEIDKVCGTEYPAIRAQAIAENWTGKQAAAETLKALRAEHPSFNINVGGAGAFPNGTKPEAVIEAALFNFLGNESTGVKTLGAETMQVGRALQCRTLLDMCAAALRLEHRDVPASGKDALIKAAFSTTSLSTALSNVANKSLMERYQMASSALLQVCRIENLKNFKEHTFLRPSSDNTFAKIAPGGKFTHGTMSDDVQPKLIADTYGKMLTVTRHDIINDDLGVFNAAPDSFGQGAARMLADLIATVLLANKASDGSDFFSVANKNLTSGGGSAFSMAGLDSAQQSLLKRTDVAGNMLTINPEFLAVPPELLSKALTIFKSNNVQRDTSVDNVANGNAYAGLFNPLCEPRLSNSAFTGYSTTAWYLFGPQYLGAILVGFVDGATAPHFEIVDASSDTLGMSMRAYFDPAATLGDPRAVHKMAGV